MHRKRYETSKILDLWETQEGKGAVLMYVLAAFFRTDSELPCLVDEWCYLFINPCSLVADSDRNLTML
jgi:hypothetical protein